MPRKDYSDTSWARARGFVLNTSSVDFYTILLVRCIWRPSKISVPQHSATKSWITELCIWDWLKHQEAKQLKHLCLADLHFGGPQLTLEHLTVVVWHEWEREPNEGSPPHYLEPWGSWCPNHYKDTAAYKTWNCILSKSERSHALTLHR